MAAMSSVPLSSLVMWWGRRHRKAIGYTAASAAESSSLCQEHGTKSKAHASSVAALSSIKSSVNNAGSVRLDSGVRLQGSAGSQRTHGRSSVAADTAGALDPVFWASEDDGSSSDHASQNEFTRTISMGDDITLLDPRLQGHRRKVQRITGRDAPDYQSLGRFNVKHRGDSKRMLFKDLYHVMIHMALWRIIAVFWVCYLSSFFGFAVFWSWASQDCDIHINSFLAALYFSIETQMSIGFGAPDSYFDACFWAAWVLPFQSLVGVFLDVTFIGLVFAKISTSSQRALTVVFSDVALLQVQDDSVQLVFRAADMSGRPLSQCVIQVYCVQHREDEDEEGGVRVDVAALQLQEQSIESQNGVFFFGLPTTVVHTIDWHSPFAPPQPTEPGSAASRMPASTPTEGPARPPPDAVREHLQTRPFLEVVVLLGGIEDSSSSSVEARHSYTLDDMYWDRMFLDCVSIDEDGYHEID
eukprot:CAMPEP_0195080700 /NCGR_PEP_ID=MMETSP0448-20130528/22355_1 /TAXON_ID=66468 /ORGANISM="Heterocapsa triquestra, Strain CCMP 448" /LENGTH=469 /DNA_ID=CAMNT_0040113673 /DNA_START=30 /DNA_END=1436 /DNA_ORIENTATION=+